MSSLRENSIKKCRGVVKSCQIVPNLFKAPRKFFLDFLSPLLYNTKGGEGKSYFRHARAFTVRSARNLSFALKFCTSVRMAIIFVLISFALAQASCPKNPIKRTFAGL